jgi:hypothetical protein
MTEDELIAKGNAILTRFARAAAAAQRVGELSAAMNKDLLSDEQIAQIDQAAADVANELLEARAELAAYSDLLAHRRNVN